MQFAVGEDLNRNHFIIEPINIAIGLYHYFVEGFYHASTIQKYVVFPVCFITCCYVAWQWIRNKTVTKEQSVFFICGTMAFICSFVAAADEAFWFDDLKNFNLRPRWFFLCTLICLQPSLLVRSFQRQPYDVLA